MKHVTAWAILLATFAIGPAMWWIGKPDAGVVLTIIVYGSCVMLLVGWAVHEVTS